MEDCEQILRELAETDMRHGGFIKSALDEIEYIRQQLTAALAACESKDVALSRHINVDNFLINCPFDVTQKKTMRMRLMNTLRLSKT